MDSSGIAIVLWQSEMLGQEHESAGEGVIDVPVSLPEFAVLKVVRVIIALGAMHVLVDPIKQVAHEDRSSKGRVRCAVESLVQGWRYHLLAAQEGALAGREASGHDLDTLISWESSQWRAGSLFTSSTSIR